MSHLYSAIVIAGLIAISSAGLAACSAQDLESWEGVDTEDDAEDIAVAEQEIYFDADLGSIVGSPVAQGTTCGAGSHFASGCGSGSAHDRSYYWTAPWSGSFTFTTAGSTFDTVLQIMNAGQTSSLACNDDSSGTTQSSITLNLSAGQKITIIVDGYSSSCGTFKLNISSPGGNWTPWLDRDNPSGKGDYETLVDFLQNGQACPNPAGIQCQTLNGVDWTQTGEVYSCTAALGGYCINTNQPDGSCLDYRVRFLCP